MKKDKEINPHGKITVYKRGYGWLPEPLRKELDVSNIDGKVEIPFILDANCAILLRKGATQQDILNGLSALIHHLSAKWRMSEKDVRRLLSWLPNEDKK